MSATLTIGGISLDAFAKQPTPQELAAIVARWDAGDQAEFLIHLEDCMVFCIGRGLLDAHYIAIAEHLLEDKEEWGIGMLHDIVGHAAIGAAS